MSIGMNCSAPTSQDNLRVQARAWQKPTETGLPKEDERRFSFCLFVNHLVAQSVGEVRGQFGVPAQMACSTFRQVGATYRVQWTRWRKNQEARAAGLTKRRFKELDQAPKYVSPTATYVFGHDYSLKTEQRVSLLTLAERIVVPYQGWRRHVTLLRETAEIGEAKLW